MLIFDVIGQRLLMDAPLVVEDSNAYLEAQFNFHDEDWKTADDIWAHFEQDDKRIHLKVEDGFIEKSANLNLDRGYWKVYLHASSVDGERITTNQVDLQVKKTGTMDGEVLPEIPLSAAEQISLTATEAKEIAQSVRDDAAAGKFDGFSPIVNVDDIEGGHRVVITDSDDTSSFDVLNGEKGDKGDKGDKGADGFSPTLSAVQDSRGTTVFMGTKNGTDSFLIKDGKDGLPGKDGTAGKDGEDGVSATIDVEPIVGGHRVTVSDKRGSQSFNVMDGGGGYNLPAPIHFGFSRWPSGADGVDNFYDIAYGNGRFVAIGSHDNEQVAMITTDFVNFQRVVLSEGWRRIKFINKRFFLIGRTNGLDVESNTIKYSEDGVVWTEVSLPVSAFWRDIAYGKGYYVVISGAPGKNSNISAYSSDLNVWTQVNMPHSDAWFSLAFGNGHFNAIAYTTGRIAAFYPDSVGGSQWFDGNTIGEGTYFNIYFYDGKFYIPKSANWGESTNQIRVGDVLEFEIKTLPISAQWQTMAFGAGYGVVFAHSSDGLTQIADACFTSDGGETWEHIEMPVESNRVGSAYGRETFVCIGREYIDFCYLTDNI